MTTGVMQAEQVVEIVGSMTAADIRSWIIGGWGIDALVGEQTRDHHDLDMLVRTIDLPAVDAWLRVQGFARADEWEENAPVSLDGRAWDTAFVAQHPDGRELDVHAVHVDGHSVSLATRDPWVLPSRPLDATGTIKGRAVRCVTADAQRAMHRSYELPEKHREDMRRLDGI